MKRFVSILLLLSGFCILGACSNTKTDQGTLTDHRPMVFVNDLLYAETADVVSELPSGTTLIGTIEKLISQSEDMLEENFCSNNLPIGSEIYYDSSNPDQIYIKLTTNSNVQYSIYEVIQ